MVNHPKNIDEFFKQSLSNAELAHGKTTWGALRGELIAKSFLKFNPYTVNVYYVLPVIAAIVISLSVYNNYKPKDLIEDFSEEFVYSEPVSNTNSNVISVKAQSVKTINTNVYSNDHVGVEREDVVEITMETIELSDFSSQLETYEGEIKQMNSAPTQIVDSYEQDIVTEEIVVKKKSKKKSRPLKMH